MSIHQPPSPEESNIGRNIFFADKIDSLLKRYVKPSSPDWLENRLRGATFRSKQNTVVRFTGYYDLAANKTDEPDILYMPDEMEEPVFHMQVWSNVGQNRVKSPYGTIPDLVIDTTDRLFSLSTRFYFDKKGRGVRHEEVSLYMLEGQTLEDALEDAVANDTEVEHVDEPLSEDDSRSVPLDESDYEQISKVLTCIEQGDFQFVR